MGGKIWSETLEFESESRVACESGGSELEPVSHVSRESNF